MDMNKAFYLRKEDRNPKWVEVDAEGQKLGRLATKIADILRGKHKPEYTPHTDAGDYVVVLNADKIVLSGQKRTQKEYPFYSGYIGGLKIRTAQELLEKHPDWVIRLAVKRMLPKSKLANAMIKKLKVYTTAEHPHKAQVAAKLHN